MAVKKISVRNFKSFENMEVELGKFNVLIGANASGKSNFVQVFAFLRDIVNHRLENAISMQGGIEYLRNVNIGSSRDLSIAVTTDNSFRRMVKKKSIGVGIEVFETNYCLDLKFGDTYQPTENVQLKCRIVRLERVTGPKGGRLEEKEKLGEGTLTVSYVKGVIRFDFKKEAGDLPLTEQEISEEIAPRFLWDERMPRELMLIGMPFVLPSVYKILSEISIHDFDPRLSKKATPITGKADLEEDGSNLAIVLKNIIENEEKKRKLTNLVGDILPFVADLDVVKFADKSLLFTLKDKYCMNQYVPASLLSDGTINITALIIALYFQEKPLIIVEEPDRNIHPHLISKAVYMMKEASEKKQIIVSTHNPEVIKHAGLENILFVSRDKECFSNIQRLSQREEIKRFLENEIGVEELFVQGLLGV